MALYKYGSLLEQSSHQDFDTLHNPGDKPPDSGIYRCEVCGDEIAANKNQPLPPQNHHQHAPGKGPIRWQLLVCAVQK